MEIHIHHHHHYETESGHPLERIFDVLIQQQERTMSLIDDLTANVEQNTTVIASVQQLVQNMAAQLTAAGTDPVKLKALSDQLNQNDKVLADLVAANTTVPIPPGTGAGVGVAMQGGTNSNLEDLAQNTDLGSNANTAGNDAAVAASKKSTK